MSGLPLARGETRRLRILLIAYSYPPEPIIGALRPASFARWLPEFGIDSLVLARSLPRKLLDQPRPPWAPVFEVPSFEIDAPEVLRVWARSRRTATSNETAPRTRRLSLRSFWGALPGWRERVLHSIWFPDVAAPWYLPAVSMAKQIVRQEDIDLLFSTSPPGTAHLVAAAVKRETGRPWIADYRDAWSDNPYQRPRLVPFLDRMQERLERSALAAADRVVTTSGPYQRILRSFLQRDVEVIYNGFEVEDMQLAGPVPVLPKFTISYTGEISSLEVRDPTALFQALQVMLSEEPDLGGELQVRFLGESSRVLAPLVARYGVASVVQLLPRVDRSAALRAQMESHALLLIDTVPGARQVALSGKVFEYIATGKPILLLAPKSGAMAEFLAQQEYPVMVGSTAAEVLQHLRWLRSVGWHAAPVSPEGLAHLQQFTRRAQASRLAEICYGLVG
ncbi:MAG: glycosyltransferase [Terriglobales bacterium]